MLHQRNDEYFKATHGCMRCTTLGELFHSRMSFPKIDCPLRTDHSFRNRLDEDHHKENSPLEKLPIDMVNDFIVADSLHLIYLGIMRKCINMWVSGTHNYRAKWHGMELSKISEFLIKCNSFLPKEIHRAMRGLNVLKFWKGLEYRTFLLYISPILLSEHLPKDIFEHFLLLYCSVVICSCDYFLKHINAAESMLKDYIELYIKVYGIDSISSNVHNLCHLVNDVRRFGALPLMSSYVFENHLGKLKRLIQHGNSPLVQVAKRTIEISHSNSSTSYCVQSKPQQKS